MKATLVDANLLRALSKAEIQALKVNWCRAEAWDRVMVADPFDPDHFKDVYFGGDVEIGPQAGSIDVGGNVSFPTGIYEAAIINCRIGSNVLIRRIGSHLSGYDIGAGAVLQNVGLATCGADASFGNGVEVEVANEAGGREVMLFDELTSQIAFVLAFFRHRPRFITALKDLIQSHVASIKGSRGMVGDGAVVRNVGEMVDVRVGPGACISGALRLVNGTLLSEPQAPSFIGSGVVAEDFIIAEGASVDSGSILTRSFVGQGTKMGRGFSSENSLFFCNCEAFHGEAVAAFAGPYTVTHHKGTLLIGALLSFYNAGSATNMSNHMYKLGPVHQGVVERGSKTGSGSYLLWPSRIGAFSVVLGKNFAWFDASDFPFSYISGEGDGKTYLVPGMNLVTVGTTRDAAKWPKRDRRKAMDRRDLLTFEVFNPWTLAALVRGEQRLTELQENTDRAVEHVVLGGLTIKRLLLRTGIKAYRAAIDKALAAAVMNRIESIRHAEPGADWQTLRNGLIPTRRQPAAAWIDLGGLVVPSDLVNSLCDDVEQGRVSDLRALRAALSALAGLRQEYEWAFIVSLCAARWGKAPSECTEEEIAARLDGLLALTRKHTLQVLGDAEKEYDQSAKTGYGLGAEDAAGRDLDFEAVRGSYAKDSFHQSEDEALAHLGVRVAALKDWLSGSTVPA